MKIGVNARLLNHPFTGIGQYTKNLFFELAREDEKNTYVLVVPEKVSDEIVDVFPNNVEIKVIPQKSFFPAGLAKVWWEQISLPSFFSKEKVDIAFFTYPSNPWFRRWYKKKIKTALTVHDCIPWTNKNYRRGILSKMYHKKTRKAVGFADIIFTVSSASAKDLSEVCNVQNDKIKVAYNDASPIYKSPVDQDFANKVLRKFNLEKNKYLLYVGGYDKRKNVEFLLNEHKKIAEIPLVLVGGKLHDDDLYESFDEKENRNVIRTGFLEEKELACLYRRAFAFINLSLQEGFNIPILEAANCGAPLILSDIPVHREVAGENALFVDISSSDGILKVIEKMRDDNLRIKFCDKSSDLAQKYSFKKTAQIIKSVLFS
jgi:glycosyltransferase involved in cell wall biosynthesis